MTIAEQIQKLRKELNQHNYNYYTLDNPTISDYDFDVKLKQLQDLESKHPEYFDSNSPTQRVGGTITKNSNLDKYYPNCPSSILFSDLPSALNPSTPCTLTSRLWPRNPPQASIFMSLRKHCDSLCNCVLDWLKMQIF